MWQSTFYLEIVLQISFLKLNCYNLSANLVSTIQKWTFATLEQGFSYNHTWSCRVVAYRKQKTKEYIKFLAQKVVAVALEMQVMVAYERVFETVFDWETKGLLVKWSLTRGGRLPEVVAMRELTVNENKNHWSSDIKEIWNVKIV